MNGEFKEFGDLAGRLQKADFSGESRVKNVLRERLLDRVERPRRRVPVFAWALPAAAAAALFIMFGPRHKTAAPELPAYAAAYNLQDDGYGPCGRRGLADYNASGRF